jgi:hypothetical protein
MDRVRASALLSRQRHSTTCGPCKSSSDVAEEFREIWTVLAPRSSPSRLLGQVETLTLPAQDPRCTNMSYHGSRLSRLERETDPAPVGVGMNMHLAK